MWRCGLNSWVEGTLSCAMAWAKFQADDIGVEVYCLSGVKTAVCDVVQTLQHGLLLLI
jgi:hypothetical protein